MSDRRRIWFQKHTVRGRLPLLDQWYEDHLASISLNGTTIDIHTLPPEAYPADLPEGFVRYGALETFFASYFTRQAVAAEREGYDAFVIGTSQDAGLREARSLVSIPVLGYGETAFHIAGMAGQRFAVVGFIPELQEPIEANIVASGLARWLVGFQYIENGAALVEDALRGDPAPFLDTYQAAAQRAIAQGAQQILPGEGLPNEVLYHLGIHHVDGVPIIDPDALLVKAAELMVDLERQKVFTRSSAGYWFRRPDAAVMDLMREVFWR